MTARSLLTIGEVARRAGIATSAIRYYERRGLLRAAARVSGQRRYSEKDLRKVVFVGLLQDAGLTLDDIDVVLNARSVAKWKAIALARLEQLEAEMQKLARMHELLQGAVLCRYDHPLSECKVMGRGIDDRLVATANA